MCQRAETSLDCGPESVAAGRHFVAHALSSWGAQHPDPASACVGDVLLVASELLGNAVRACSAPITLLVEAHRGHIHIGVRDDSPQSAIIRQVAEDSDGGRGLAIVDTLARRWGQTPYDGAKWVWADVPIGPGSVLGKHCDL